MDLVVEAMVEIGREAAAEVLSFYRRHEKSGIAVDEKAPGDPVTEADRAANERICTALASRFPDAAVIAEESVPADRRELEALLSAPRVFFVDPLDGTREFVEENPEFSTMIGVAERGRAVAGAVAMPVEGTVFAGRVGGEAFVDDDGHRQALAVSDTERFEGARMLASRSHLPPTIEPLRKRLGVERLIRCGSAGVKVSRIARGAADFYAHDGPGLKLWDSCGPEAVLVAAGGRLTDLDGGAIDYAAVDVPLRAGMLASNGPLHAGALSAVTWARRHAR